MDELEHHVGQGLGLRTTALGHSGRCAPENRRPFAELDTSSMNGLRLESHTDTPFVTRYPSRVGESGPQG